MKRTQAHSPHRGQGWGVVKDCSVNVPNASSVNAQEVACGGAGSAMGWWTVCQLGQCLGLGTGSGRAARR